MTATATDLPRLLERGDELARLRELIGGAAAGRGRAVAITGPAGIGKTSLLDAARAHAVAAGVEPLAARGGELERDHPYGVARQLFERRLREMPPHRRETLFAGPAAAGAAAPGAATAAAPAADTAFAVVQLTNREIAQALFVTVRTVQVHLAGAFRKLGVDSRRELATVRELAG